MKISIISINYKTKERTASFIKNISEMFLKEIKEKEVELIVVDNLSEDGSVEYLKKTIKNEKFLGVTILENSENAGFGRGNNFGASHAKGEYLLFLNNDTKVLDKGILHMADFLETHPHVAILGGRMQNENRTPQLSAWKFYTLGNAVLMLLGFEKFGLLHMSPLEISRVDWVTGGCMMVRKKPFEDLSGFDPQIFMYMEDMELCFRAEKNGYSTYYYPHLEIIHEGQGSSNRTFAIVNIYKGLLYFYRKWMPFWQTGIIKSLLILKATTLIITGKIIHNSYLVETYEKALAVVR